VKIAVIGGAGVRTPLLVHGLVRSDLPLAEIALYDIDQARLAVIGSLAGRLAGSVSLRLCQVPAAAIDGAAFVFTSIRVGGIESRARDEATVVAHGVVGQETIGPGGFAMAVRTIPHLVAYARDVQRMAPDAWIVNFTNPVGVITQAVVRETGARIIGICDTPTELFEEVAHLLDLPSSECRFDYFGLNHLGWLREVYHGGRPCLGPLFEQPDLLRRVHRASLFAPEALQALRLLPTEYLYFYDRPDAALARIRDAGRTRGAAIAALNARLFSDLAAGPADPVEVYEQYLARRNAGYMQIESGAPAPLPPSPWAAMTGYDKIALAVVRAIHFNSHAIIPLNVANHGAIRDLADDDIVEVPTVVTSNGAVPIAVGPLPAGVRDLVLRVKAYERLTIDAALTGDAGRIRAALAANPLVSSIQQASTLADALGLL